LFAAAAEILQDQLVGRVGQCVMTAATTACFDDLPSVESVRVGSILRFFGDGHQISKVLEPSPAPDGTAARRRFWRIPVMDGEFVVEERFGRRKGVAGGDVVITGRTPGARIGA